MVNERMGSDPIGTVNTPSPLAQCYGVFTLLDFYSDSYSDNMQKVYTGTDSNGHSDAKSQWILL